MDWEDSGCQTAGGGVYWDSVPRLKFTRKKKNHWYFTCKDRQTDTHQVVITDAVEGPNALHTGPATQTDSCGGG